MVARRVLNSKSELRLGGESTKGLEEKALTLTWRSEMQLQAGGI